MTILKEKMLNELVKDVVDKGITYLDGDSHDIEDVIELENDESLTDLFYELIDYTKEHIEIKPEYQYINFFKFVHHKNTVDIYVAFVDVYGASIERRLL